MKTYLQSHTAYRLLYQIVWIPKKRHYLLNKVEKYCEKVIRSVISDLYQDVIVEEINVQKDHIHLMLVVPPKYSISKVVGDVKRASSRTMRQRFDHLKCGRDSLWSTGYFVSSVGLDEKRVRHYIKYQQMQDSGQYSAKKW